MMNPAALSPGDEHLDRLLGELDEDSAAPADSAVRHLHAELAVLADDLRQPLPPDAFEDESACRRAREQVREWDRLSTPHAAADPAAGEESGQFGQYRLLARLGQGGMGVVYKALHLRLDRVVALKVLPAGCLSHPRAVARFDREMKAIGRLDHPHVVRARDAGEVGGTHYLVMEYLDGIDLAQLLARLGPLPVPEACELIRQAALGLEAAHAQGLIHRDVKPSNLMLAVADNGPPLVKVLDLGLARISETAAAEGSELTADGQLMGTLDYMAPEQGDNSHAVDGRADVYSLGASLYALLTGRPIFHGDDYRTAMHKLTALATRPAPPIRSRRPEIPDEVAALVHRMITRDPADRFATALDAATALAPFAATADLTALWNRARNAAPVASASASHRLPSRHSEPPPSAADQSEPPAHPPGGSQAATVLFTTTHNSHVLIDTDTDLPYPSARPAGNVGQVSNLPERSAGPVGNLPHEAPAPAETQIRPPDASVPECDFSAWASSPATRPRRRRTSRRPLVALLGLAGLVLASGVVLVIRDRDGKERQRIPLQSGDSVGIETDAADGGSSARHRPSKCADTPAWTIAAAPPAPDGPTTEPLSAMALVMQPAKLQAPDVQSWTIETVEQRGWFDRVGTVRFRPGSHQLAVAPSDGTLRLLDARTGRNERTFVNPSGMVQRLAWSHDGGTLATMSEDGTLALWDPESGRILASHRFDMLTDIVWSPDGGRLALAAGRLQFWDVSQQRLIPTEQRAAPCDRLAWKPDGTTLAAYSGGCILLIDPTSRQITREIFNTRAGTGFKWIDLAWSSDGRLLAYSDELDLPQVWDARTGTVCPIDLTGKFGTLPVVKFYHTVAWSPDGRLSLFFKANDVGGYAVNWDPATGAVGRPLFNESMIHTPCMDWSSDGRLLVQGVGNGRLLVFEPDRSDKPLWRRPRPALSFFRSSRVQQAQQWSPDGRRLALSLKLTASDWGHPQLCVWDLASNELRVGPEIDARDIGWSDDGAVLLVPTPARMEVLESRSLAGIGGWEPADATAAAYAPGGRQCAVIVGEAVEIRDTLSGALVHRLPTGKPASWSRAVAWSADGQYVAAGWDYDGQQQYRALSLWNARTGERQGPDLPASQTGEPCGFSPDGRLLVKRWGDGFSIIDAGRGTVLRSTAVTGLRDAAWTADFQNVWTFDDGCVIRQWGRGDIIPADDIRLPASAMVWRAVFAPGAALVMTQPEGLGNRAVFYLWDARTGRPVGAFVALTGGKHVFISAQGHYAGAKGIENEIVYVVQTAAGQEALSPAEFSRRYGWQNDPTKARRITNLPVP